MILNVKSTEFSSAFELIEAINGFGHLGFLMVLDLQLFLNLNMIPGTLLLRFSVRNVWIPQIIR